MAADWTDVKIAQGESESEVIPILYEDVSVPPGKARMADGTKVRGNDFFVEDLGTGGCRIVLHAPAAQDVVFKVKSEDLDAEV